MCYFCGAAFDRQGQPGFGETCPTCGKDLHVCRMCAFYAPEAHWACRESIEAQVSDKEKRNFCDFFGLAPEFRLGGKGDAKARGKAESARSTFDSLFKTT